MKKQKKTGKVLFLAIAIVVLIAVPAVFFLCKGSASQQQGGVDYEKAIAAFPDSIELFSYATGMAQSESLASTMAQNGIDSTAFAQFFDGFDRGLTKKDTVPVNPLENKDPYKFGLQMGQNAAKNLIPHINAECFGPKKQTSLSVQKFIDGIKDGLNSNYSKMDVVSAQQIYDEMTETFKAGVKDAFIAVADEFMDGYAKNPEYKQLGETGIYFRETKTGSGAKATSGSTVVVNYEGKNMDGEVFDSSFKRNAPATFEVTQVIKGWQMVLQEMPAGSSWECVIPQHLAYGETGQGDLIPPYSPLVFKIDLLEVK